MRPSLAFTACAAFAAAFGPLLPGIAAAQATAAPAHMSFESLDRNRDGAVSLNEATEYDALFVAFKSLDKNKDGALTREEFAGFKP